MPFTIDVAHQQSVVEFDCSRWKLGLVFKEAREDVIDIERCHLPVVDPQFEAVILGRISGIEKPRIRVRTEGQTSGLLQVMVPSRLTAMEPIRSSALQVGLAMGLIFAVVGLINGNYGLVGLGVVIALVGFVTRETNDE